MSSTDKNKQATTRTIRLENPDLLRTQNHNQGRRGKFNPETEMYTASKALSTELEANRTLSGQTSMPRGMVQRSAPKITQTRDEARHELNIALGIVGSPQDQLAQRSDHASSSKGSAYVSTTPVWTMGKGGQDDWGLRRLDSQDGFGANVTIADVDSNRVHVNETNTAEDELLVAEGIKRSEVSHSFWAYPDKQRTDGAKYTALLYDHKNDAFKFGNEAIDGFIDLTHPREMTGKK